MTSLGHDGGPPDGRPAMGSDAVARVAGAVGVVVIGRNEASRLASCLKSLGSTRACAVYVDSGSHDGSPDLAERMGVHVVRIREGPFSAARGRREGLVYLRTLRADLSAVQFIDGDCEMHPEWIDRSSDFLDAHPRHAGVVGVLRERHPERSVYVRLTDVEWDLPIGAIDVIGGIALLRLSAIDEVGGWVDGLVSGEELDLSARLRAQGWLLERLDAPMCTHDIGITRFREFWRRSMRAGYGYCNLARMHAARGPARWRSRALGSVVYGIGLPVLLCVGLAFAWPVAFVAVGGYGVLIVRLAATRVRRRDPIATALAYGVVTAICKTAMALGVARCVIERLRGRMGTLIEYKVAGTARN